MKKVISFTRVSSVGQNLESQNRAVHDAILAHGYNEDEILYIEQKESAIKLSIEQRQSVQKLFNYIKQYDSIEYVFIYEISRLSRQTKMLYEIRDFLIEHKVNLKSLKPELTLLDENYKLSQTASIVFSLFASISESEMMIKNERLQRGKQYKRDQGMYVDGLCPFGYVKVDQRLELHPVHSKIVQRLFTEYANGESLYQLARKILDEGVIPTSSLSADCMRQRISLILNNEYYCGDNIHPQIVSRSLFDEVQNKRKNKVYYKKHSDTLCKGLLVCAVSGYRMKANIANGQYYVNRAAREGKTKCTTISIKAADILVGGVVTEWYNNISNIKAEETRQNIIAELERQRNIVKQQENNIINNQSKIDRIEERYIEGVISKERADELERKTFESLQEYKNKLIAAKDRIVFLESRLETKNSDILSLREKALYVVDFISVRRLSYHVCELIIVNKWTGERRVYEYNTLSRKIIKMEVKMQDTLNWNGEF